MWFDGWSLIITWGKDNTYIDMYPIYLSVILGFLFHKLLKQKDKNKKNV